QIQTAPVHAVRNGSRVERHREERQRSDETVESNQQSGAREVVDQPRLGDLLHPVADVADDRATPQESEVTMAQGAKRPSCLAGRGVMEALIAQKLPRG